MAEGVDRGDWEIGCTHYKRKCKLVAPCCEKVYPCRFCHNDKEDHELNRRAVKEVECTQCLTRQDVAESCVYCNLQFGKYFCNICCLYDDQDKGQFHCVQCGLCRQGGKSFYYHCEVCDTCLHKNIRNRHKCVERVSRADCPVCLEYLHTSTVPLDVLFCGHLIHRSCQEDLKVNGKNFCPVCMVPLQENIRP